MNKGRYLSIYHEEVPSFLHRCLESRAMQRLKGIDMNCGVNYVSFPLFAVRKPYSRYEHCLGTALIAWHFTGDRKQAYAALFHDIAAPVFSHAVDFLYGDHLKQEATEERTAAMIEGDETIMSVLKEEGILLSEVSDYHLYPICDNDSPQLSADRLEYTIGNMIRFGFADETETGKMYDDLCVAGNEQGIDELSFRHAAAGLAFARGALACGRIYSSGGHRFAMETLAGILRDAIRAGILSEDDLYRSEAEVIGRLLNSPLQERWQKYRKLKDVQITDAYTEGCLKVPAKKRYIDPLIEGQGRVSSLSESFRSDVSRFMNENYDVYLKGEYNE